MHLKLPSFGYINFCKMNKVVFMLCNKCVAWSLIYNWRYGVAKTWPIRVNYTLVKLCQLQRCYWIWSVQFQFIVLSISLVASDQSRTKLWFMKDYEHSKRKLYEKNSLKLSYLVKDGKDKSLICIFLQQIIYPAKSVSDMLIKSISAFLHLAIS